MSDAEFQLVPPPSWLTEEGTLKTGIMEQLKQKPMTGLERITEERMEQKIKHKFSIKSDAEKYPDFELGDLAAALLGTDNVFPAGFENEKINKMRRKSYMDRLVIAGALIAAQIDVLNFKED